MQMKPKLVRIGFGDLSASYLEQILAQYFDLDVYDDNKTYDKSTVFAITRPEHLEQQHLNKHLSQGCKLIVANLWEARSHWHPYDFKDYLDNVFLIVGCKNLFDFGWKHMVNVPNWFFPLPFIAILSLSAPLLKLKTRSVSLYSTKPLTSAI